MYMDPANRRFGAWRLDDTAQSAKVKFSVFFPDRAKDPAQYAACPKHANGNDKAIKDYGNPHIASIHVVGDFQTRLGQPVDWTKSDRNVMVKSSHPKGFVYSYTTPAALPAGYYQYKYFVTFDDGQSRWVSDPCSRYGGVDSRNSAFVVGPSPVASVNPIAVPRKHLRDLVVYELNIDDFTDEFRGGRAALDAVCDKLDTLVELGVNAILFLPWTAWADDTYSWGYTPYQYFSVEHRYTNDFSDTSAGHETKQLSRLRNLINQCHARGIHVIMDGVFNHVGPDIDPSYSGFAYRWLYRDPEASPYVGVFGGTFGSLKDLDYHNGCTQEFIRDVCFYWMDEFNVDGIRFDNTTNFYVSGDARGLPTLLADIAAHAGDTNFSLTLEHIDMSAAAVTNDTAATSFWNDSLYACCFDYLWNNRMDSRIMASLDSHAYLSDGKISTMYLSNHDHSHVAWQSGASRSQYGKVCNAGSMNWFVTQPYAIALLMSPGAPMIQNGQEFAEDHWIPEDDSGSGRRVKTRPIRWSFLDDGIGSKLFAVYKKLIAIRTAYPALRSDNFYPPKWESWKTQFNEFGYGIDTARRLMIFHRWGNADGGAVQKFIVALNFSDSEQCADIPFSEDGVWTDLLSGAAVTVQNCVLKDWKVASYWGHVFFK